MTFVNLKQTTVRDVSKVVISVVLHLNKAKGAIHKRRQQLGGGRGQKLVKIADRYYHKTSDMGEGHTHYTLSVDIS